MSDLSEIWCTYCMDTCRCVYKITKDLVYEKWVKNSLKLEFITVELSKLLSSTPTTRKGQKLL